MNRKEFVREAVRFLCLTAVLLVSTAGPAAFAGEPESEEATWTTIRVPGAWESVSEGRFSDLDGFAWYRCQVKIPEDWDGERWRLTLNVPELSNAGEVYVNGEKIGEMGSLPPNYTNGKGETHRMTIPDDVIRWGAYNLISFRVYNDGGKGGFTGNAPTIIRYHHEIPLEGQWQFRPGDNKQWANPDDAGDMKEARFKRTRPGRTPITRPSEFHPGKRLSPEEAMERFDVAGDLELDQVLHEPQIAQPVSISFDGRGRLWVVEYRQYPFPAGLKMVSRDKYYRASYDRSLPPPPYKNDSSFRGRDRISIHEDTDGDGTFDRHKTFVDGLNITTAVAHAHDGVWVLSPPQLLFYPDRNGDDVPDGDPEVHLTGFGLEDTHSVANSLRWGPDGWLYGCQGSTVTGHVKRPGSDMDPVHSMGQHIWRYHPPTGRYEIFAEGGGNAFGIEIDSKGHMFSGHNGSNTRGFHYVQGGYFRKGFDKHGSLSNPYAFGQLKHMKADKKHPRFTHTFTVYEAEALPERYRGNLFAVQPLMHKIVHADLLPDGSTFRTKDVSEPVKGNGPGFRPVDIQLGPDGAVYVADFYEDHIAHGQNYKGYIDPKSGRVYRLRGKNRTSVPSFNVAEKETEKLLDLLDHSNRWVRRTARRLIAQRESEKTGEQLKRMFHNRNGQVVLEAMWVLNWMNEFDGNLSRQALVHDNPDVRRWAVRLTGDDHRVDDRTAAILAEMAQEEPDPHVRSQLACTARRLSPDNGLPIVSRLLKRKEDVEDPHIPLLLWWAIEEFCGSSRNEVLDMLEQEALWNTKMMHRHISSRLMRRFAATGDRKDLLTCAKLLELSPGEDATEPLIAGFEKAYENRAVPNLPEKLESAMAEAGGLSLALRVRRGEKKAIKKAIRMIERDETSPDRRLKIIRALGNVTKPDPVEALLRVATENDFKKSLRRAALASLQNFDREIIPRRILDVYNDLDGAVRQSASVLLASRSGWTRSWLQEIDGGQISPDSVPQEVIPSLRLYRDKKIRHLVTRHFGARGDSGGSGSGRGVEQLLSMIRSGSGDPYHGKAVYKETCASCHTLFRQGKEIGPDLTSYPRNDLRRLVTNIVKPGAEIREGYRNFMIRMKDGRTLTGFLSEKNERVVVLRTLAGRDVSLKRENIRKMNPTGRSLMPKNLLAPLSDQQIRDLVAYLRQGQPLNN